ncbi:MAG: hypothetical protein J6Y51_06230 [Bacteroidaceae bacterium]|nr:hypothetical protein [Bacteroidaceae bacterium]
MLVVISVEVKLVLAKMKMVAMMKAIMAITVAVPSNSLGQIPQTEFWQTTTMAPSRF